MTRESVTANQSVREQPGVHGNAFNATHTRARTHTHTHTHICTHVQQHPQKKHRNVSNTEDSHRKSKGAVKKTSFAVCERPTTTTHGQRPQRTSSIRAVIERPVHKSRHMPAGVARHGLDCPPTFQLPAVVGNTLLFEKTRDQVRDRHFRSGDLRPVTNFRFVTVKKPSGRCCTCSLCVTLIFYAIH
jgi:hypothetical protein